MKTLDTIMARIVRFHRTITFAFLLSYLPVYSINSHAIRLIPPKIIALPVAGEQLRSKDGSILTVPNTATAVALNVTAVDPTSSGFITVWS